MFFIYKAIALKSAARSMARRKFLVAAAFFFYVLAFFSECVFLAAKLEGEKIDALISGKPIELCVFVDPDLDEYAIQALLVDIMGFDGVMGATYLDKGTATAIIERRYGYSARHFPYKEPALLGAHFSVRIASAELAVAFKPTLSSLAGATGATLQESAVDYLYHNYKKIQDMAFKCFITAFVCSIAFQAAKARDTALRSRPDFKSQKALGASSSKILAPIVYEWGIAAMAGASVSLLAFRSCMYSLTGFLATNLAILPGSVLEGSHIQLVRAACLLCLSTAAVSIAFAAMLVFALEGSRIKKISNAFH
ncbi:MAG: hypothetical protein FWG10_07050 [Eubacteriaceae bacterium]|nr:hypothetical protein [Eubacteriaceae bacterium]